MRYPFAFVFLSATLYSCGSDEPPQEVASVDTFLAEQVTLGDSSRSSFTQDTTNSYTSINYIPPELIAEEAEELSVIRTQLKRYETPSQYYSIAPKGLTKLKGTRGLEVAINAGDLETADGKPVTGPIDIEIREALDQSHFLRHDVSTLSNGKLLVSGGAYYVNATADGVPLKLKAGRSIPMRLPRITDSGMSLFYGQTAKTGEINWVESSQKFAYEQGKQPARNVSFVMDEGRKERGDTVFRQKRGTMAASQFKATTDIIFSDDDTLVLGECGEWWPIPKSERNIYNAIAVQGLGWINCDRFLNSSNLVTVNYYFNPSDSIKAARLYLVFKSINSVMSQDFRASWDNNSFAQVPAGYSATIIAIGYKNGALVSAKTDITATNGQQITLSMNPLREQDIPRLFAVR